MRIAFLGLGIMGSRMAANLACAGIELTVWNRSPARAAEFSAAHPAARVADTPAAAAACADIVFTMVVDGPMVSELLFGEHGAVSGAAPNTLFVDCSTIGIAAACSIGAELEAHGMRFLDAPVTGSAPRAAAGTLVFMAGGEESDLEEVREVLEPMAQLVVHAGPRGQGQAVKVINNAVAAVNATTLAEALALAAKLGSDLDALVAVLRAGSGGSVMADLKSAPMRTHDYTPLFKLDHMLKDIRLCLDAADSVAVEFPFARTAESEYSATSAAGHGDDDFASIVERSEQRDGVRLR